VCYGAAEFSRDVDFAIVADAANLSRRREALAGLQAEPNAVPPLEAQYLRRGQALHFRCRHPEAFRMRVDVMSKMRGVDPFAKLWRRRTVMELPDGIRCDLLSLPDLARTKKTQRDRDWPMIRRLLEAHYFQNRDHATVAQIPFWLRELRTPELLLEVAGANVALCKRLSAGRPLLTKAVAGSETAVAQGLHEEEALERERDRLYWAPLRQELEALRHPHRAA
jgi:hypothetical protein